MDNFEISEKEHNEIYNQMLSNYVQHAYRLLNVSSDNIAEAYIKATIRNDTELMYITELALSAQQQSQC